MTRTATTILAFIGLTATAIAGPVTVTVRQSAKVVGVVVQIGNVADLSGGSTTLRRKIAELDLTELKPGRTESLSRRHVEARLLLSDVSTADYHVTGSSEVLVEALSEEEIPVGDAAITAPIQLAYASRLKIPADHILVQLTQPVGNLGVDARLATIRPLMPSAPRFGDVRMRIGLYVNRRLVKAVPVSVRVQRMRTVATATEEIERGQIIQAEHLELVARPVDSSSPVATAEQLVGRAARHAIGEGQRVSLRDVSYTVQKKTDPYVIRTRAAVRIVARKGSLTVFANAGEAMQNGRIGDFIRVRNTRSGRIVAAKVISSTEVQVSF